jgi:hypothetical protein
LLLCVVATLSFKQDDVVYICISSGATKYHSHYCQGLKKCTHEVKKISKKDAIERGYGACGYCY